LAGAPPAATGTRHGIARPTRTRRRRRTVLRPAIADLDADHF